MAQDPQVQARGLLRDVGGGGVEVLLPVLIDGLETGDRPAVSTAEVTAVLREWRSAG